MNFSSTTTPAQTPLLQWCRRHQRQRQSTSRIYRPPRSCINFTDTRFTGKDWPAIKPTTLFGNVNVPILKLKVDGDSYCADILYAKCYKRNDFHLLLWYRLTLILNEMIPLHHYCFRYQSYPRWIYRYHHREMISPCPRNVIHWVQVPHHHVASTNKSTSIITSSWSSSSITADDLANWAYPT